MRKFFSSLSYIDTQIVDQILVEHGPDTTQAIAALLDELRLPLEKTSALKNMAAWLIYYKHMTSDGVPNDKSFDIERPFLAAIDWPKVQTLIDRTIGPTDLFSTATLFERVKELVQEAGVSEGQRFEAESSWSSLRDTRFNDWPKEIKCLVIFTLNINNQNERANFRGADLQALDLREANLSYADFEEACLEGTTLSGIVCDHTNFKRASLKGANLSEAKGHRASFVQARLQGANLPGAVFREADFSNADLQRANLSKISCGKASFKGADLKKANLNGAVGEEVLFEQARLEKASLRHAHFPAGKFVNAVLEGAVLQKANLFGAALERVNAKGANFFAADLENANFNFAHCQRASFVKACLITADFSGAILDETCCIQTDLTDADLDHASVACAEFSHAKLTRACFSHAYAADAIFFHVRAEEVDFSNADLESANFFEADLRNSIFVDADIDGAVFAGADFGAYLPQLYSESPLAEAIIDDGSLDRLFNHLQNNGQSTLLSIDSIDNRYADDKIAWVRQIITQFCENVAESDRHIVIASLCDFFFSRPLYHRDAMLAAFIHNYLLPNRVAYWNSAAIGAVGQTPFSVELVLEYMASKIDYQRPENLYQYQTVINQLLVCASREKIAAVLSAPASVWVNQLKAVFLTHPAVLKVLQTEAAALFTGEEFFFISENGLAVLVCDARLFAPLICISTEEMNVEGDNFEGEEVPDPIWIAHWFFTRDTQEERFILQPQVAHLEQVFSPYRLLALAYTMSDPYQIRATLIRCVLPEPSASNEEPMEVDAPQKDYGKLFLDACKRGLLAEASKLTSFGDQQALAEIFNCYLIPADQPLLQAAHKTLLWERFLACNAGASIAIQNTARACAALMLSCAVLYTHASSSTIFGKETESPQALRFYASALLAEAFRLEPGLFGATDTQSLSVIYEEWQNKLLGKNEEFTCTAILSEKMQHFIATQAEGFPEINPIFEKIYPSAWR